MKKTSISDQKRLVRGEHWIMARRILRARDHIHNGKWKILMVAGPEPSEEINCIKELMPAAHITAVDILAENVDAAKFAGANRAIACDLSEYRSIAMRNGHTKFPPESLGDEFDAISLDLTGPANDWLAQLVNCYWKIIAKNGVLIVNCSYGRDVVEVYQELWDRSAPYEKKSLDDIDGMPTEIKSRLLFLLKNKTNYLQSCIQYRGKQMPMLSCLLIHKRGPKPFGTYTKIDIGDFELAVTSNNLGNIYACPKERIEFLRRSIAAKKAVQTKKLNQRAQGSFGLVMESNLGK